MSKKNRIDTLPEKMEFYSPLLFGLFLLVVSAYSVLTSTVNVLVWVAVSSSVIFTILSLQRIKEYEYGFGKFEESNFIYPTAVIFSIFIILVSLTFQSAPLSLVGIFLLVLLVLKDRIEKYM